jgi:L-rhamnose mutarotase
VRDATTLGRKMIKTVMLSMCLAASLLSLDAHAQGARAQDERQYNIGPVTEVDYIHVEYGHFAEYVDWLNSTWKPTMEALKKAGIIIDYKVFQASPKSPDQPNIFLMLTYKNMAAYAGDIGDKGVEFEAVAKKVICSTACQNKARVGRNEYRKVLGTELIREVILK